MASPDDVAPRERDDASLIEGATNPGTLQSGSGRKGRAKDHFGVTRLSAAWTAAALATVLGVALVVFIVQNTRSVKVQFFGASGHIPVAVALLAAALIGAIVVLVIGIARTTQIRLSARRRWRRRNDEL